MSIPASVSEEEVYLCVGSRSLGPSAELIFGAGSGT